VADTLSRIFEGQYHDTPSIGCVALLQSSPLFYFSVKGHQKKNPFCVDLQDKIQIGQRGKVNVQLSVGL
jgi:hypothetical protein